MIPNVNKISCISKKISELTCFIKDYRLKQEVAALLGTEYNCKLFYLSGVVKSLENAEQRYVLSLRYQYEYDFAAIDLERAVDKRIKVRDNIQIDEISIWLDLFELVFQGE